MQRSSTPPPSPRPRRGLRHSLPAYLDLEGASHVHRISSFTSLHPRLSHWRHPPAPHAVASASPAATQPVTQPAGHSAGRSLSRSASQPASSHLEPAHPGRREPALVLTLDARKKVVSEVKRPARHTAHGDWRPAPRPARGRALARTRTSRQRRLTSPAARGARLRLESFEGLRGCRAPPPRAGGVSAPYLAGTPARMYVHVRVRVRRAPPLPSASASAPSS